MARTRLNAVDKPIKPGRIGAVLATLGREIAQDVIPVGDCAAAGAGPRSPFRCRTRRGARSRQDARGEGTCQRTPAPWHACAAPPRMEPARSRCPDLAGRASESRIANCCWRSRKSAPSSSRRLPHWPPSGRPRPIAAASMPRWRRWKPRRITPARPPPTRHSTSRFWMRRITRCCRVFGARSIPSSARCSWSRSAAPAGSRTICRTTRPRRAPSMQGNAEKARAAMERVLGLYEIQDIRQEGCSLRPRAPSRACRDARQERTSCTVM